MHLLSFIFLAFAFRLLLLDDMCNQLFCKGGISHVLSLCLAYTRALIASIVEQCAKVGFLVLWSSVRSDRDETMSTRCIDYWHSVPRRRRPSDRCKQNRTVNAVSNLRKRLCDMACWRLCADHELQSTINSVLLPKVLFETLTYISEKQTLHATPLDLITSNICNY